MPRRLPAFLALTLVLSTFGPNLAVVDEFDRLEGESLVSATTTGVARDDLTVSEIGQLPNVLPGLRSAPIVVRTNQGNLARLLIVPGVRKPPGGRGVPVPILVLKRFETFEVPGATTRLARGRDLVLFHGFVVDLDTGQVVPEGQGGDLRFVAEEEKGTRLSGLNNAKIFTFDKSPLKPGTSPGRPSPGRAVLPGDFAGRYRLFADGRWSGLLELKVDDAGAVSGTFRSDQTGASYRVTGHVAPDAPQKVLFSAELPRSRLEFTGHLWTEGKGAMAGTASLLNRDLGFFAIREGGHVAPDGADAELVPNRDVPRLPTP